MPKCFLTWLEIHTTKVWPFGWDLSRMRWKPFVETLRYCEYCGLRCRASFTNKPSDCPQPLQDRLRYVATYADVSCTRNSIEVHEAGDEGSIGLQCRIWLHVPVQHLLIIGEIMWTTDPLGPIFRPAWNSKIRNTVHKSRIWPHSTRCGQKLQFSMTRMLESHSTQSSSGHTRRIGEVQGLSYSGPNSTISDRSRDGQVCVLVWNVS